MVINGASRRNVGFWVKHLQNDAKNDRAELREVRGLAAENLADALHEMQDDARDTRCKNFMYQVNFNPCEHEHLTEAQWERAFEIFEQHRGIPAGQPRVVYEHEKEGRIHRHVIWSRIILEEHRAWSDGLDAKICHAASREIERELGLERTPSPLDKDRDGPRPPRAPKSYEMFRGLRSGSDPRDVTEEVTMIFRASLNAADFVNGLRQHGYELVQGDRAFCILDRAGDVHSLARRIDGINTKELRTFMQDIDRATLPTVDQAKARFHERNLAERRADLATVQHEIAWENALAKAAIDKEKVEGRFKEAGPKQVQPARAVGREKIRQTEKAGGISTRAKPDPNIHAPALGKAAVRSIGKTLDFVGNALESFLAPQLTPEQKREGEIASRERRAEADEKSDFNRHQSQLAQERQRQEQGRVTTPQERHDRDR
jgi:relaxase-like protein